MENIKDDIDNRQQPVETEVDAQDMSSETGLNVTVDEDDLEGQEDSPIEDTATEESEIDASSDQEEQIPEWVPEIDEEFLEEDSPEPTIESVIEAILFTTDEPVTPVRMVKIADLSSAKQVTDAVKLLNERYEQANSAFRIEKIAGGYQMLTHKIYNNWLRRLIRVRTETKLTQASLETLAIIAYKQPVIRADVEAIRGVSSGEMIRGLMSKGLVKIAGRAEVLGRPMQYGTTRKFLENFGLNSLRDLPKADELKKPRD
ncbi:MAG: SMC-Scp complex subunit ScpB [Sedimentisphaeraceae bacterium JB056]